MKTFTGRLILVALCLVWALATTVPAQAQSTVTATLDVNANIIGSCTSVIGANMPFGSIVAGAGGITTAVDATTSFTVQCDNGLPYSIDLGNGNNPAPPLRRMSPGAVGSFLSYQLYTDSTHSTVWGTGLGGVNQVSIGSGANIGWPVFGQIPAQAGPLFAGAYNDTVMITVTF